MDRAPKVPVSPCWLHRDGCINSSGADIWSYVTPRNWMGRRSPFSCKACMVSCSCRHSSFPGAVGKKKEVQEIWQKKHSYNFKIIHTPPFSLNAQTTQLSGLCCFRPASDKLWCESLPSKGCAIHWCITTVEAYTNSTTTFCKEVCMLEVDCHIFMLPKLVTDTPSCRSN